ncbi:MAG: anthranilate synthase component I family protein [Candidatus Omnitrophica bacterium]|nr:anthranilate synthase component I family protein [Candidatus Omnitrophota bacterium]
MVQYSLRFAGDAFNIFRIFKDQPNAFFLDSSLDRSQTRFSYIGFDPFTTISACELSQLKKNFNQHRFSQKASRLSFPAGAVGYLGFDGSLFFGFYDTILTVDHKARRLIVSSLSKNRLKDVLRSLHQTLMPQRVSKPFSKQLDFISNFTKAGYIEAVRSALEHIRRGDIYQINLSHQIRVNLPSWRRYAEPTDLYGALRRFFPSEFGAYFDDGRQVILSASPERFLRLQKDIVQVKPMKGTRPRGKNKIQDRNFREELLKSPKEIAELLMVTDLERNDLGRVCDYSSVKVKAMRTIETYASVFQATSTVEGRLYKGFDQFDLLKAAFPSGSVTGCPKIEAMKIIKKLEHGPRGLYTGALGYISFSGNMDFNVMIRTMFLKRDEITFHVGGGIVADSKPQTEWQETWIKAQPLMDALNKIFRRV